MRLRDFAPGQLNELSPATLASYKKKAGAAATAADAEGDTKTGNKRFSGIVKATKKQFDQDAKGVSENREYSSVTNAITRRIITQHPEVLAKYGPDVVGMAIDEIAEFVGDVDEIGSSDVSGWTSQVIRSLARFPPLREQGVAEGKADYNFDIEDLKRLERIRDLATLKTQAMMLISKPSAKPMRPEKVEWFRNALEKMNSPLKVIKLMYDLLLSGEGHSVVGSRSSMNPNSYRQRFNEQDVAEDSLAGMKRLAGIASAPAQTTPGQRQYRHMPTAVQPR